MLTQEEIKLAADTLRQAWHGPYRVVFSNYVHSKYSSLEQLLSEALSDPRLYDRHIVWGNATSQLRKAGLKVSESWFDQHYSYRMSLRSNPMALPLHADPVRSVEAIYNEIVSPTAQEINLEDWL